MASATELLRLLLVKRKQQKGCFEAFVANEHGKLKDTGEPMYKRCCKTAQTKGTDAIGFAEHLKDRHIDLFKEFQEVVYSCPFIITEALRQQCVT